MAVLDKKLCSGSFGTTEAILYTVPTGKQTIVKAITICNTTSATQTIFISLGGVPILSGYLLPLYDSLTIPYLDQIIDSGDSIEGYVFGSSLVSYYISGKEVDI
jgi:hypothetical protein